MYKKKQDSTYWECYTRCDNSNIIWLLGKMSQWRDPTASSPRRTKIRTEGSGSTQSEATKMPTVVYQKKDGKIWFCAPLASVCPCIHPAVPYMNETCPTAIPAHDAAAHDTAAGK